MPAISLPSAHAIAILIVAVGTFYLYTRPWIRMELVSLLLIGMLLCIFNLFPYADPEVSLTDSEVLEAFGHPALIAICCLMVLGRGLSVTGALDPAVRVLGRVWQLNRSLGLAVTLVAAGLTSAFVNDTPVLVLMLPLLLRLGERTGYATSKTLLPVNYAILLGGLLTSIGTSTNLLVLKTAEDLGVRSIGLFDFTGIALVGFAVALPYLWLILPRILPDNSSAATPPPTRQYDARIVVAEDNTQVVGKTVASLSRVLGRTMPLMTLQRAGENVPLDEQTIIEADDVLYVRDTPPGLREIASALRTDLFDREGAGRFMMPEDAPQADVHLAEIVVGSGSRLVGRTLRELRFAEEYRLVVVGLYRGSSGLLPYADDISDAPLVSGDVLLVQGTNDRMTKIASESDLLLVDAGMVMPRSPLAPLALGIMAGVILVAATGILPIHVSAALGVIAMLLTGCVKLDGIGRALSLEVVLLVAASVALGRGLVATGAAAWLGDLMAVSVVSLPAAVQLGVIMAFAALLTNFVSNAAAAAIGTPIAVATAAALGAAAEPFVLAVLFGANLSFATPTAYQSNVLVMNAAGYRFGDFVRGGLPLVLLMLGTLSFMLAHRYGL